MAHDDTTNLAADTLADIAMDNERQAHLGPDNDLAVTRGIESVAQSIVIHAGGALRPLVGEPITNERIREAEAAIDGALSDDPQVENVQRIDITDVDSDTNTVEVEIFVGLNNSFTVPVEV